MIYKFTPPQFSEIHHFYVENIHVTYILKKITILQYTMGFIATLNIFNQLSARKLVHYCTVLGK